MNDQNKINSAIFGLKKQYENKIEILNIKIEKQQRQIQFLNDQIQTISQGKTYGI